MYLVSSCLCGINCKYNGGNNLNIRCLELVKEGKAILICPEQLGGLNTPRVPAEIRGTAERILNGDSKCKIFTKDNKDVTCEFLKGAQETLKIANLYNIKKAILKEGSPSCGVKYVYDGTFSSNKVPGMGLTARILEKNGIEIIGDTDFGR